MWTSVWKSSRWNAWARNPAKPRSHELVPGFHLAVEVVDHEAEQDQPQAPDDRGADRPARRPSAFKPSEEGQPEGEPDREEELRHDRVGIAAIRVVMLPDGADLAEAADEVDQQHAGHGVAAELVERGDAALTRGADVTLIG